MLETKVYTTQELLNTLNISTASWKRRKEEYLDWFKAFFDYDLTIQGEKRIYIIKEIFGEYEPLPRKKKSVEVKAYYAQETSRIVKEEPTNTGANIARNIVAKKNKYNHKEGTASVYVRDILKGSYQVSNKTWCKRTADGLHYEPITEEQLTYLNECITQQFQDDAIQNQTVELYTDYEAGILTRQEFNERLGAMAGTTFLSAMDLFVIKYGFRPMKIPMWVEGAFKE